MPNGNLWRTGNVATGFFTSGGKGGVVEELDRNGNAIWSLSYNDETKSLHHDIEPLANGNVLALTWEDREIIWSEVIVEIEKTGSEGGNVVSRWDVFDHLDE
ncbi:MAG: aryl-sulfate sulfotransferase [Gammaproteobacteria bacterium]|nr:aryl-sulfate sulfotransferase [Gammaproteobacteria bacterium]